MHSLGLYMMSLVYIVAGISHFRFPGMYKSIMPKWIPWHAEIVFISGVLEVLLGVLLLIPATRVFAAWGLIILLIAVFPANVQMMLNYMRDQSPRAWITVVRLPIQLVLIWWAYQYTRS